MFALIYETFDYTNVKFITHKGSALEEFAQEKEEAIGENASDYCKGLALIEIKGDGNFQVGLGFTGDDNIVIVDEWNIEE